MEPALGALLLRAAVPRLKSPAWHGYQVLLQRIDAGRIGDLIIIQRAGAVRVQHELVTFAWERGDDAEWLSFASEKLPRTVSGVPACIACAWWDSFQRAVSAALHSAQVLPPTK
jgi:hypothetical protein